MLEKIPPAANLALNDFMDSVLELGLAKLEGECAEYALFVGRLAAGEMLDEPQKLRLMALMHFLARTLDDLTADVKANLADRQLLN